jgi:uroporphyrinogen-III synthase
MKLNFIAVGCFSSPKTAKYFFPEIKALFNEFTSKLEENFQWLFDRNHKAAAV